LGILFCGQFSGGHCNPAVTTVFFLQKKSGITFYQYILYIVSQIAGAFVGSIIGKD
jgi:glycerol uptake facilitator-like aquaporin